MKQEFGLIWRDVRLGKQGRVVNQPESPRQPKMLPRYIEL